MIAMHASIFCNECYILILVTGQKKVRRGSTQELILILYVRMTLTTVSRSIEFFITATKQMFVKIFLGTYARIVIPFFRMMKN